MSFQDLSREIAQDFLQTVVVVDDNAFLSRREPSQPELIPQEITDPLVANSFDSEEDIGITPDTTNNIPHPLNAKALNDSFAEKGLVCAVLRPDPEEVDISADPSIENENLIYGKTFQAAKRADLLILDWNIYGHYGEVTKQIISEVVLSDIKEDRLRLIAIYTGEPDLSNYIIQVAESLNNNERIERLVTYEQNKMLVKCGPAKIVILGKKDAVVGAIPQEYERQFVNVEDLADSLITTFTSENMGLLSNVCLTSISSIRKKTHKLLGKFTPELDAAYLTHRLLLKHPKESEEHLIPLITEEILAILQDNEVGKNVNIEEIKKWLTYKSKLIDFKQRVDLGRNSAKCVENLAFILEKGLDPKYLNTRLKKVQNYFAPLQDEKHKFYFQKLNKLTDVFTTDGNSGRKIDCKFSQLTKLRSRYSSPLPRITLGTIIKSVNDTITYYLCIQPRCDSVRVSSKGKSFLFLRMTKAKSDARFDLIIEDNSEVIYLNYNIRSDAIVTFTLKPKKGDDEIIAREESGQLVFEGITKVPKPIGQKKPPKPHIERLSWVTDLKPDQAQLVSNQVSAQLSRVGLNDYEWLRRQS